METAFDEGYDAFMLDVSRSENPYDMWDEPAFFDDWDTGWMVARENFLTGMDRYVEE